MTLRTNAHHRTPSSANSTLDARARRSDLFSPADLADYLGVPLATVYRWRSHGDGPEGIRVGRHVRYRTVDVERWLDEHRDTLRADHV